MNKIKPKGLGGVPQVVKCLLGRGNTPRLIPSTALKKKITSEI
jgi:hypothetical protein